MEAPSPTAPSFNWAAERGEKWLAHLQGMEAMIAPVNGPLTRALELSEPCRIADVGCGGGATTLEIHRRAPAGSVVHGYDISPALIESAGRRAGAADPAVDFRLADVATAAHGPYDRIVSRFGVMFFGHPAAAFENLARWLRPGGRFAFAVWGPAADNPWASSVSEAVAAAVDLPSPDPDGPGPFRYGDGETLVGLLERAGFRQLELETWRGQLPIGGGLSAQQAADFALSAFSVAERLEGVDAETAAGVREALAARFRRSQRDGRVLMDACVHLQTGTR